MYDTKCSIVRCPYTFHVCWVQTQLSLSKLALLACGSENGDGDMQELDRELRIIKYQRNIPASVVEVRVSEGGRE